MIRPLRATHQAVFLFLPVFLPLVLIAGLASRYRWPTLAHTLGRADLVVSQEAVNAGDAKLKVDFLSNRALPNEITFKLLASSTVIAPDVLVYWAEGPASKVLNPNARLLGAYREGMSYRLPADTRSKGSVILYSLAQQKVVANIPLGAQL